MVDLVEPFLPESAVSWLLDPATRAIVTVAAWLGLAGLLLLALRVVRLLGWRTRSELDDILLSEVRRPLVLLAAFAGFRDAIRP